MFIHFVLFWFNEDATAESRGQTVNDCRELLGRVPTVRSLWSGRPAMTPREVVDNSYDVGLCVVLEDEAGHEVYQRHELHMEFIRRNKANWKRVQVYDFKH